MTNSRLRILKAQAQPNTSLWTGTQTCPDPSYESTIFWGCQLFCEPQLYPHIVFLLLHHNALINIRAEWLASYYMPSMVTAPMVERSIENLVPWIRPAPSSFPLCQHLCHHWHTSPSHLHCHHCGQPHCSHLNPQPNLPTHIQMLPPPSRLPLPPGSHWQEMQQCNNTPAPSWGHARDPCGTAWSVGHT